MKSFLVIPNLTREKTASLLSEATAILGSLGAACDIHPDGSSDPEKSYDAVIFLGGDGTMLRSAHTALGLDLPMVGINAGSLGYYSRIKEDELSEKLPKLVSGDIAVEECALLTADGKKAIVNDLVAMVRGSIATFTVSRPGGREIYKTVSSGIIASTTIGSTGINRSAGGSVLENGLEVAQIAPILPNRGDASPLVIGLNEGICISWNSPVELKADGELFGTDSGSIFLSGYWKKLKLIAF
ncbi:MAG: NAD(+)/NADH kinase [Eubacteriaceae bacterium]|nr:NAD(+)/NADH kinase [Eubacteriaceae bacterium]